MKRRQDEGLESFLEPMVARLVGQHLRVELARLAHDGLITFRDPELLDADLDARFGVVPAISTAKRRPGA